MMVKARLNSSKMKKDYVNSIRKKLLFFRIHGHYLQLLNNKSLNPEED
jgi:hypothetical protein